MCAMAKPMEGVPPLKERREREARKPYTKEELRAMLPKVGDRLMETLAASTSCQITTLKPEPCTVVEVNVEHLWYRVVFDRTGVSQCFKLPETTYTGPRMEALV